MGFAEGVEWDMGREGLAGETFAEVRDEDGGWIVRGGRERDPGRGPEDLDDSPGDPARAVGPGRRLPVYGPLGRESLGDPVG